MAALGQPFHISCFFQKWKVKKSIGTGGVVRQKIEKNNFLSTLNIWFLSNRHFYDWKPLFELLRNGLSYFKNAGVRNFTA